MKKEKRTRFIKRYDAYIPKEEYKLIPSRTRGIYALLKKKKRRKEDKFNVVYIGMSDKSIRRRIKRHQSKMARKKGLWTHFSIFEVNDKIANDEIRELEGLFRVIYKSDTEANKLNKQKTLKRFKKIKIDRWNKK